MPWASFRTTKKATVQPFEKFEMRLPMKIKRGGIQAGVGPAIVGGKLLEFVFHDEPRVGHCLLFSPVIGQTVREF
jgi:hypothetical protein